MKPCKVWQGAKTGVGYGAVRRDGRVVAVHRLAWIEANGPIPSGMCVLHRCDNRACYEATHLWLGTRADNMADMWAKGRGVLHPENLRWQKR